MITQITRKLEFDAGHRVLGHETKCKHLHGHRYVAMITVSALGLDSLSRVVDFSVVKAKVGTWIDDNWDHNILLNPDDPLLDAAVDVEKDKDSPMELSDEPIWQGKQPFIMGPGQNPTAEVMAHYLFDVSVSLLEKEGLTVERVRLYETPNCYADYTR